MGKLDDRRDLWNQQTPFALAPELQPLFLQRLKDSLAECDMRDGQQDWTPSSLAAHANVRLDDYLLFYGRKANPMLVIWKSREAR